jgi:aminoglycoside/choline kinase family phosphotransferase
MEEKVLISEKYKQFSGHSPDNVVPLLKSGSDRKYFRITDKEKSLIGAFNSNNEENEAFIGFTEHFRSKNLPVPEVYGFFPGDQIYFLQDLGDTNLFTWLLKKLNNTTFDDEVITIYREVLDILVQFQTRGIDGLNLELCYPHKSFDRESMMWDMNYFKYMFLKLISAPFNERKLENDFGLLSDFILKAEQKYFLYRDFQSANIMIVEGTPWFIDYQGGRKGAPQYDVASLLYDAKAHIPQNVREILLNHYISTFCVVTGESKDQFLDYYTGFCIIRLMQALGAFGFRGLYEKKPTFAGSIVPAVRLLLQVIDNYSLHIKLSELFHTIKSVMDQERFQILVQEDLQGKCIDDMK